MVGAPEGWNLIFIRTETGEKYFEMVHGFMEIMEDPKPNFELVGMLIKVERRNNAENFLKVSKKFSFGTRICN